MTEPNTAAALRRDYKAHLDGIASTRALRAKLASQHEQLKSAIAEADAAHERTQVALRDTHRRAAIGELTEADLESAEAAVAAAAALVARRRSLADTVRAELDAIRVPDPREGERLLDALGTASARELVRGRDIERALDVLAAAYARWGILGGLWPDFLADILPAPSEDKVSAAREAFLEEIEPISRLVGGDD